MLMKDAHKFVERHKEVDGLCPLCFDEVTEPFAYIKEGPNTIDPTTCLYHPDCIFRWRTQRNVNPFNPAREILTVVSSENISLYKNKDRQLLLDISRAIKLAR